MSFVWEMVRQALDRIASGEADMVGVTLRTLWLAFASTAVALLVGLPLGVWLGEAATRARRIGSVLANAGLGLPPVVLGVFLALALLPGSLLGGLQWTSTIWAVLLAQILLALPIVVALTASAVAALPPGLLDQARAFHAGWPARAVLAVREARIAVLAAVMAALGSAVAEVGAVVIVGGNIRGQTNTLASTVLLDLSAGDPVGATADVIVLLALVVLLGGVLTIVQQSHVRRAALRAGAAAVLVAAPMVFAACGGGTKQLGPHDEAVARRSIAIDYASYYAPYPDLRRLVAARARDRGARVRFSEDPSGSAAQVQSLKRFTGEEGGFRVVAVAPFAAASVAPIAADAIGRGVKIVSYVVPLVHQTAAIRIDEAGAAALLAGHARSWARRSGRRGGVLIVGPPARAVVPDPFVPYSAKVASALERELFSGALGDVTTTTAVGEADAEQAVAAAVRADPGIDYVLTTSDTTALGAARALRGRRGAYVGGVGAPAVSGPATLDRLDSSGPLRALVAPRLRDLANALVDVPLGLLRGQHAPTRPLRVRLLTPRSTQTARARADYQG